jgi:hypothetical protein
MKNPFEEDPNLEKAIESAFTDLNGFTADEEEYQKAIDQLVKLQAMRKKQLDPNTVVIIGTNLLIAVLVLRFERTDIVSTKLFGFLRKT